MTTLLRNDFFQVADSECDEPPNIGGTSVKTSHKTFLLWLVLLSVSGAEARTLLESRSGSDRHPDTRQHVPDQHIYTPGKFSTSITVRNARKQWYEGEIEISTFASKYFPTISSFIRSYLGQYSNK